MKLKIDSDEIPVFWLDEPTGYEIFDWCAVELSDKEWQDYKVAEDAYAKWQKRLKTMSSSRVATGESKAKPQYLGNGRVWDGRSEADEEVEEASTPRKRDILDRMAAKHQAEDDGA
jgi:hypothetical protein